MKRIAIPESDTNWTVFLTDAKNVEEIILYTPVDDDIYKKFEKVQESFASDVRFKLELTAYAKTPHHPAGTYEFAVYHALSNAEVDMRGLMSIYKVEWDLHSVQPAINLALLNMTEFKKLKFMKGETVKTLWVAEGVVTDNANVSRILRMRERFSQRFHRK